MLQISRLAFTLFLLASGCPFVAVGQTHGCTGSLEGIVADADGNRLPGAIVWVEAIQAGTTTSADGAFVLRGLCAGSCRLTVKYVGYADKEVAVNIPQTAPIAIEMATDVRVLHEVVVEGDHAQQHSVSQAVSVLTTEDLNAAKGKPLGEMLQRLPGVSSIMMGPTIFKPVIHGLHSQRILILNNGLRQEGQQWGMEHAPELDTYIASEIEVVKGAEAVRYGADALGGVIIINTPSLHQSATRRDELNVGLMSNSRMATFSGMVEGGFKKSPEWRWRLQGSAKKGGDFEAPDYNLSNTGVEELNGSAALGFKDETKSLELYASSFNTTLGILRSAHTGNLTDLQSSIENQRPWYVADFTYAIENPRQQVHHHLLKVKGGLAVEGVGRVNILYGGQFNQRKEYDVRRGGRGDKAALSMQLFSHALDASLDHTRGDWSGSVGLSGALKKNHNVPGTGIKPLLPDYDQWSAGVFAFEKIRRGAWLLEAGARFDHQYLQVKTFNAQDELIKPVFNFNYFAGSVAASYFFSNQVRFLSNLGVSMRPPHVSETYSEGLHHGTGSIEEGMMLQHGDWLTDAALIKKEISKKWINTFQVVRSRLVLEASGYVNAIDNFVYLRPLETRLTIRGYFPVFQYRQTDALLAGGDVSLQWDMSKRLRYNGKASYVYASDVSNHDKLPYMPPVQLENAITYTRAMMGVLKNVYITLRVPTVLKQHRAPMAVYPKDVPAYTGDKNFDFMPAPAGYSLLHAEAGATWALQGHDLLFIIGGENLFNTAYRNYMNRLRYYADDLGRNFTLRVKYTF